MRLEELVRTLEAEVHRLREENARLEQLEDENEELLQEVWAHRERLIEEVKESDTTILRTSEERRAWLHGLFDEALREMLAEEIERRESAEAENARLVEELRVAKEALNRIALGQCDSLAADPMKWPTTIAKQALGWTFKDGKQYPPGTALSQSEAPKGEE